MSGRSRKERKVELSGLRRRCMVLRVCRRLVIERILKCERRRLWFCRKLFPGLNVESE